MKPKKKSTPKENYSTRLWKPKKFKPQDPDEIIIWKSTFLISPHLKDTKGFHELHRKKKKRMFSPLPSSQDGSTFFRPTAVPKLRKNWNRSSSRKDQKHQPIILPSFNAREVAAGTPPRTIVFLRQTNDPQNWDTQTTGWNQECKQQRHQDSEFYNVKVSHRFTSCGHCTV